MTSADCKNGTERCLDAYKRLAIDCDVIVNIQGDEPFIQRKQVDALIACFDSDETDIATLVKPFEPGDGLERLECPNSPKVVVDEKGYALYFSRSVIPYLRGASKERAGVCECEVAGSDAIINERILRLRAEGGGLDAVDAAYIARVDSNFINPCIGTFNC